MAIALRRNVATVSAAIAFVIALYTAATAQDKPKEKDASSASAAPSAQTVARRIRSRRERLRWADRQWRTAR